MEQSRTSADKEERVIDKRSSKGQIPSPALFREEYGARYLRQRVVEPCQSNERGFIEHRKSQAEKGERWEVGGATICNVPQRGKANHRRDSAGVLGQKIAKERYAFNNAFETHRLPSRRTGRKPAEDGAKSEGFKGSKLPCRPV